MAERKNTTDPESAYETPAAVLATASLADRDKIKALESWAFAVRSRLDAVSEGMNSHAGGAYNRDVTLIRDIEKALETLAAETGREPPRTKRTGGSGLAP